MVGLVRFTPNRTPNPTREPSKGFNDLNYDLEINKVSIPRQGNWKRGNGARGDGGKS